MQPNTLCRRPARHLVGAAFSVALGLHAAPAAAVAAAETVVALASLKVTTAVVASGAGVATTGAVKDNDTAIKGGVLISVGGLLLGLVDPPAATFYSGAFTVHYDGSLMQPLQSGWLGSWGADPSLPAPPTDTALLAAGVNVVLQAPASGLSAAVSDDAAAGLQSVSFSWGAGGHAADSTAPFNFYASLFQVTHDVRVSFLGNGAEPPAGANFFVSSGSFACSLPGDSTVRSCGDATTQYYQVTSVPEPSIVASLGLGLMLLCGTRLHRRRRDGG